MNRTVAVVVTYNRKNLLEICIEKLLGQKNETCDILIIDNASTDGTAEMIREKFDRNKILIYENTGTNLGGAGGFEYGAKRALQLGYDYVWFMDDDTFPDEKALSQLLQAGQKLNDKWGFLCSAVYWTDGSRCCANIPKKTIFRHLSEKEYFSEIVPVKMASFVSLFVKCSVIKKMGLPIGEYFIWTDDYEFTGRISGKYPCYMVSTSCVLHAMRVHTKPDIASDDLNRMNRYFYLYRNDVHCYRQFGLWGWIYIILKDVYAICHIICNSNGKKVQRIRVLIKGFVHGCQFIPKINSWTDCE